MLVEYHLYQVVDSDKRFCNWIFLEKFNTYEEANSARESIPTDTLTKLSSLVIIAEEVDDDPID